MSNRTTRRSASPVRSLRTQDSATFDEQHEIALAEFKEHRKTYTRKIAHEPVVRGPVPREPTPRERKFVLVDALTAKLRNKSPTCGFKYEHDLERLYMTASFKQSLEPPSVNGNILEDKLLRIFYILLELGYPQLTELFHNQGLDDTHLPLDERTLSSRINSRVLEDELGMHDVDFYRSFCDLQRDWCPMVFELEMGRASTDQIVPLYMKEPIQPHRDDRPPPESNARLWKVDVPEELIGPKLRKTLIDSLWREQDVKTGLVDSDGKELTQMCRCYRFALKQFRSDRKSAFDRERKIFYALGPQKGLIQYIGWYDEKDQDGQQLYNIVLECGDFDLYTAFRNQAPPVSPPEIKGFYQGMLDVSEALYKIHQLKTGNFFYDVWHADVKPENILRVQECFKLADPGEAHIRLASGGGGPARAVVTGGTRVYGSPEKAAYIDNHATAPASIPQNSDVWSLGCVFSVAATYVVLGPQGVLQYDKIRRHTPRASQQANFDGINGAFHDGNRVLKVVTEWHEYLRSATRRTDAFTADVLTMVDEHMLVTPEKERWDAKQVESHLRDLLNDPKLQACPVPDTIESILQEIDLQAEQYELSIHDSSRVDSVRTRRSLQAIQASCVDFKSADELLNMPVLPTAQRSEQRTNNAQKAVQTREKPLGQTVLPRAASDRTLTAESSGQSHTFPRLSTGDASASESAFADAATGPMVRPPPMTMWQVEDQLEKIGKQKTLASFRHGLRSQPVSVKGVIDGYDDLKPYYKNRDIIYLVDNGSSMLDHWGEAKYLLRVLVWRSLGYDDDGMELYFTDPKTTAKVSRRKTQIVENFMSAMDQAKPRPRGRGEHRTHLLLKLSDIVNDYASKKYNSAIREKAKTIIIFTDGVWEDQGEVETTIENWYDRLRMRSLHTSSNSTHQDQAVRADTPQGIREASSSHFAESRPITFQFVAFGHDAEGIDRMKRLDDNFQNTCYPDLIDMEPSNGDVYKMFLGSLDSRWDTQENTVNAMPSTPIYSPPSFHGSASRSRAGTRTSGPLPSPMSLPSPQDNWQGTEEPQTASGGVTIWPYQPQSSTQSHQSNMQSSSDGTPPHGLFRD
ncbi:Uu.00g117470.m01.CDS01 [Anthostomella pinea]|uniref:Uu.00g117470.m01.CDS01 n=1 Tax=Anthostomella pinea TaxID=933095 RepID=A0AAI8VG99_9PEZI|nr:Uu.00g117470.m01.CDS01 [Anthostomella pinea]